MHKALPALIAFLSLALAIALSSAGCGGGGGGGSSSGGSGGNLSLSPATNTIGANGMAHMLATVNGVPVDVTWSSTAGFVTPTGIGTAIFNGPASGTAVVTATAGSQTDTATFTIDPTRATVSGRIVDQTTLSGIGNAIIEFRDGNTIVATATSLGNGYFSGGVSPAADTFHVRASSISSAYYKLYTYNSLRYTMTDSDAFPCRAPLPALTAGGNTNLQTNLTVPPFGGPPPPPPNGCQ